MNFRLNQFKALARWLDKKLPGPLAFFLKGWLYGLESQYIAAKASAAVEKGIAPIAPSDPVVEPPTYQSEPSAVEGLNIISLTNGFSKK
jgi:hypothetical protein